MGLHHINETVETNTSVKMTKCFFSVVIDFNDVDHTAANQSHCYMSLIIKELQEQYDSSK